jgi:glycosyltransferase involved in cell wall biosynthesis
MAEFESQKTICFVATLPVTLCTFLSGQSSLLVQEGWDVTWISRDDPGFRNDIPEKVRFVGLPFRRGIDTVGIPSAIWQLYRIFKAEKFSIVQYSTPNAAFYASTASFLAGVPVRLYAQWGIRYVGFQGAMRWFFKQFERWVCFCSTIVEPDSKSNLIFSIEEGLYKKGKGRVVGHGSACGVDLKKFDHTKKLIWREEFREDLAIKEGDIVVGFVGSLRKDKGVNELLAACRTLFSRRSNAKLLLIGDKTFYQDLEHHLRDWAESSEQVIFVPPTGDIPQYMACMDIFCLPSYREGFGLVIVEAEAMGVPVVVSDVPGPIDAMENHRTGIAVPVGSTEGLAIGIRRLLDNPELRVDFGRNARNFALEKFEQQAFLSLVVQDKELMVGGQEESTSYL